MPLREHLAELRRRFIISVSAIALCSIAGWFLYPRLFQAIQEPLLTTAASANIIANINYADIMQAFNLHLQIAVYLGFVIASPIWLYQSWAFVMPGLTRREKWQSIAFAAVGTPLFIAGIGVGWMVLPNAVTFFTAFAEPNTSVLPDAGTYVGFVTRLLLVFGIAFLLPLVLVALNLAGLISGRAMASAWRVAVFVIFLFAAIASPTPDAGSMLALAIPMCLLFALAAGFAMLIDRRRAKRGWGDLADDEVSPLDAPTPIDLPTPVDAVDARTPGEQTSEPGTANAVKPYDDVL